MNITVRVLSSPRLFRVLSATVIAHASIVLMLWLGMFYADLRFISGRWWLLFVWLWPLWSLLLMLHPARTVKHVAVPVVIGIALIMPCVPTALAFSVWALKGFAP